MSLSINALTSSTINAQASSSYDESSQQLSIPALLVDGVVYQAQLSFSNNEFSVDKLNANHSYAIVDTGQTKLFSDAEALTAVTKNADFWGQDAHYVGAANKYIDNGNGTVSDLNTGLMWQKTPDAKTSLANALANATTFNLANYHDWRVPTIKELYSLMNFNGQTGTSQANATPYIHTGYFDFSYGDTSIERYIDAQFISSTQYVSTTMLGDATMFGVNFADGRIKGYPIYDPQSGGENSYYLRYVRGNTEYGNNKFVEQGELILDQATGLTWLKKDSGGLKSGDTQDGRLNWQQALAWCESLEYASFSDWRLPNIKELQSLVDYSRSPDTSSSATIDPVFEISSMINGNGVTDYPYFWSSTNHMDGVDNSNYATYIAFGRGLGYMADPRTGEYSLLDVHGAGVQRSDPKSGDPSNYPNGFGPQGDVIRIYNYARCVR